MMVSPRLRVMVNRIAVAVAALIAIGIPAANFYIDYSNKAASLAFKSRLGASRAAQYIYTHDSFWQYQQLRLGEIIQLPEGDEDPIAQSIHDKGGALVLRQGATLRPPVMARHSPIVVSGETVGMLSVETSLWSAVVASIYVDLLSVVLAAAAYFAMRWLPLRALDRALDELRTRFCTHNACGTCGELIQGSRREPSDGTL